MRNAEIAERRVGYKVLLLVARWRASKALCHYNPPLDTTNLLPVLVLLLPEATKGGLPWSQTMIRSQEQKNRKGTEKEPESLQ